MADERPNPEQALVAESVSDQCREVAGKTLSLLSEREIDLVTTRYLADDKDTLEMVSRRHGITRERGRQLIPSPSKNVRAAVRAMVGVDGMPDLGFDERDLADEMAD